MSASGSLFSAEQWERLALAFHAGATNASAALAQWTGRPADVAIDALQQLPLEEVSTALPQGSEPQCFCLTPFTGELSGHMLLAFDDQSGLSLAGTLSGRGVDSTEQWDELAISAVLETANILCCAFLNALAQTLVQAGTNLMPSPPTFCRDYAESVLQFTVMDQVMERDSVVLVQTRFCIAGADAAWNLLWIPDTQTIATLREFSRHSAEDSS